MNLKNHTCRTMAVAGVRGMMLFCLAALFFSPESQGQQPQAEPGPAAGALFQEMPVVEAASLHSQTLDEAPANVTIITAADIRRYGYLTLGEALSSVRGFYGVNDRFYQYFGSRGLNLPGDYNTRFLVMLNGQPLTEAIYASNGYFGQDFPVDMDIVQRIEVVRGPTGALYGSNGMLANINIVTKPPVDMETARVSTETDSLGQRKLTTSTSFDLGKGRNVLLSGSLFNNRGQSFYIPQYDTPENGYGRTIPANDGERGYHTFANLLVGHWNMVGLISSRQKRSSIPWTPEETFDEGGWLLDARNLVGALYSREVASSGKLRWQAFFHQYRYRDHYAYEEDGKEVVYGERNPADWVNSQLTYQSPSLIGDLTLGVSGSFEFRNGQRIYTSDPEPQLLRRIEAADRQQACFIQSEKKLGRRWTAHLGLRLDHSFNYGAAFSPRLAMVYQQSLATVWKLVYGRPFRNPSAYEKYWYDGYYLNPSLDLRQEWAHTFEAAVERKLWKGLTSVINVHHYRLSDLIQIEYGSEIGRYRNFASSKTSGIEAELQGGFTSRLRADANVALQNARDGSTGWLVNSPRWIAKARAAYDLKPKRLTMSGSFSALGRRQTTFSGTVKPVYMLDVTVSTIRLTPNLDIVAGLRNAIDLRFMHPVAIGVDRLPVDRRSVFIKLVARTAE